MVAHSSGFSVKFKRNCFIIGIYSNWFEYTNVWDREIQKGKRKYLCLHYEELIKVMLIK